MGRFADLLDRPSDHADAVRPNDINDKSPPSDTSVVTTKTTKVPFGRFGRSVVGRCRLTEVLGSLEARCPDYVEPERWRLCVDDARHFLLAWSDQAEALGWTAGELFGLRKPPRAPKPSYNRLARYDVTGLIWHLTGNRVVALTSDTAAIQNPTTGNVLIYRKRNKPGLGPLGDSLDDFV
jgi:hypothetical protein